jgi:hypothetical protein
VRQYHQKWRRRKRPVSEASLSVASTSGPLCRPRRLGAALAVALITAGMAGCAVSAPIAYLSNAINGRGGCDRLDSGFGAGAPPRPRRLAKGERRALDGARSAGQRVAGQLGQSAVRCQGLVRSNWEGLSVGREDLPQIQDRGRTQSRQGDGGRRLRRQGRQMGNRRDQVADSRWRRKISAVLALTLRRPWATIQARNPGEPCALLRHPPNSI